MRNFAFVPYTCGMSNTPAQTDEQLRAEERKKNAEYHRKYRANRKAAAAGLPLPFPMKRGGAAHGNTTGKVHGNSNAAKHGGMALVGTGTAQPSLADTLSKDALKEATDRAKLRKLELEIQAAEGSLVPIADHRAQVQKILSTFKAAMDALPSKFKAERPKASSADLAVLRDLAARSARDVGV